MRKYDPRREIRHISCCNLNKVSIRNTNLRITFLLVVCSVCSMILSTLRDLFTHYDVPCGDILHPNQSSCIKAALQTILNNGFESLKVYFTLFLIIHVLQGKFVLKPFLINVLRSTLLLTINAAGFPIFGCLFYRIFGVVFKYNVAFVSGVLASSIAYPVESRSRQRLLTPYIASNCIESVINSLLSRNLLPSIPYLDVLLFMLVSGRICGRLSSSPSTTGFNDSVFALLTNPMEIVARRFSSFHLALYLYSTKLLTKSPILKIPLLLTAGCVWGLFIGLSYNIVLMTIKRVSRLLSGAKGESATGRGIRGRRRFNWNVPVFLAGYIGLFMLCKHILRNMTPLSDKLSDSIAGLLAGSAISIYRFPSLSLYLFIKELQSLSKALMHSGYLPRVPYLNYILYVITCSTLVHCVIFESKNVNPAYMQFAYKITGPLVFDIHAYLSSL